MKVDNSVNFQKLTPYDKLDLGIYKDAIDFIFANEDINNIAITGSYGAGKSSIIESYKNLYCSARKNENDESDELKSKKEFIHISLADIASNNSSDQGNINELEGKIINTLIQQINPNKIPHSSFQRMLGKDREVHKNKSIFLSVFILSSFILFYRRLIQDIFFIPQFLRNIGIHGDYFFIINFIMWSYMLHRSVYYLLNYFARKPLLKRIKILNNEIELFEKKDEDYFNKYLNEIIYLFKYCGVDAIVFEDIDRFNMKEIFIKLREINFLVNKQLLNEGKKSLKFIYLLRDDLFESKERTKFFDYIIPIIPIADNSNSGDYILELFEDRGYFKSNNEKLFLKEISLYIDDMRLIKNVYNEFEIYKERIEKNLKLDYQKLFATIVYKNIFPNDFNKFQYNNGYVYGVLQYKKYKQQEILNDCNQQLTNLYSELNSYHSEFYDEELQLSYNEEIWDQINCQENKKDKFFDISLQGLHEFQKIDLLEDSLNGLIHLNEEYVKEIKNNVYFSLLKFLLLNGYLDELTREYISYFKEGILSLQDKIFIKNVKDKIKMDYNYPLHNVELILTWIRPHEFDYESILNFDLLVNLLKNSENREELNRFIQQLKTTNNINFIKLFMESRQEVLLFVKYLNLQWPELFSLLQETKTFSPQLIQLYSLYTLYSSDTKTLQLVNRNDVLKKYISGCNGYLNIEDPNIEELIAQFKFLNVSFKQIDYNKANKDLLKFVYENSLYEINFNHLKLILEEVYKIERKEDIYERNCTSILSQSNSPLAEYIKQNMNTYIECILTNIQGAISDDENEILLILNDESVETHNKQKYIECLKTGVVLIKNVIDNSLWTLLIDKNLIQYSEENIVDYFSYAESMDDCLINWINRNEPTLDFSKIKERYEEDVYDQFFDSFIISNEIINSKYKALVSTFRLEFEHFNVDGVSGDKLMILIDEEIVVMNLKTLDYLRAFYPNQVTYFIKKNLNLYVDLIDSRSFSMNELLNILLWNVEDEIKLKLLESTDESISIIDRKYCESINEYILINNLLESDLEVLFKQYDTWSNSVQNIICSYASERIEEIIEHINCISQELIVDLFYSDKVEYNEKIDIFIELLPKLDRDTCIRYISILELFEYRRIFEPRTRPRFEIDDINNKLLTAFTNNNWIEGFEEKNGLYKISKKKIA